MTDRLPTSATAAVLTAAFAVGGCGGGNNDHAGTTQSTGAPTATTSPTTTATTPKRTTRTTAPSKPKPRPRDIAPRAVNPPAAGRHGPSSKALSTAEPGACGTARGRRVTQISGLDVSCATARATALAWYAKVRAGANPRSALRAGRFTCSAAVPSKRAYVVCYRTGTPHGARFVVDL